MRTIFAALSVTLLACAGISAETKSDQTMIDALRKMEARVFKPDAPETKLRTEAIKALREKVNKQDVAAWRQIATKAQWEKSRDERIAALRRSLGDFPPAPKSVKVVTTKQIPGDGFTIENIIYESRPGLYVTANLYVPQNQTKPMPGFIIVHSHHNPKTQGELQDMGMIWARQGCLVLIPDQLGHGERRQHPFIDAKAYPEKFAVGRQDYYFRYNVALQLHLIGESLIGWMVWDLMRGVDVLYQRPGIDKSRIIVLGSVAGGGDPCAVFAALDQRVTAAAPFNFGGPQPETKYPLPDDAELAFNYMGGGSWESTRGLRLSGRDGFLPWVIVGSLAPRGLIYGHEFAWDEVRDPVWARFQKLWGFYDAKDKLASVKGRGSVRGSAPESTHCNNIGAEHRKPMYPTLNRWFGLPVPDKEYRGRVDSAKLQCWTKEARQELQPKMVHTLAGKIAQERLAAAPKGSQRSNGLLLQLWMNLLGVSAQGEGPDLLGFHRHAECKTETITDEPWLTGYRVKTQILRHETEPRLAVPILTLLPANAKEAPVVIALAQDGKAGFLKNRAEAIAQLLKRGVAVCMPDLRGTGETRPAGEARGRTSGATSISATELMLGRTLQGTQLQELLLVIDELPKQGFGSIALWGDSFAQPNEPAMNFAVPHDAAKLPRQSEPMGGLLALLGGAFSDDVKAVYVRGGLVSFQSMLESPFCYFPHDAVIPGVLKVGDFDQLALANARHRALRLEGLVDGLNRRVDQAALTKAYSRAVKARLGDNPLILREEVSSPAELAAWIVAQVKK